jgi:hypothetical protein
MSFNRLLDTTQLKAGQFVLARSAAVLPCVVWEFGKLIARRRMSTGESNRSRSSSTRRFQTPLTRWPAERFIEPDERFDHHRVGGPVHVEPGSVGGGHRLATHCCTVGSPRATVIGSHHAPCYGIPGLPLTVAHRDRRPPRSPTAALALGPAFGFEWRDLEVPRPTNQTSAAATALAGERAAELAPEDNP